MTAVEWLEKKIKANPFRIENDRLWDKAKKMEKEQIMDAYTHDRLMLKITAEQYYNETLNQNKMKQTAVEWLVDNAEDFFGGLLAPSIIEQAKEMEKEQIVDFAEDFSMQHTYKGTAKQYYNKTFKSE